MEARGKRHLPQWMQRGSACEGDPLQREKEIVAVVERERDKCSSYAPVNRLDPENAATRKKVSRKIVPSRRAEELGFRNRNPKRRRIPPGEKITVDDLVSIAEEVVNGEERERTGSLSRNEQLSSVEIASERVELGEGNDMLDVFLGPLLRKTVEEKRPEMNLGELLLPGKVGLERETWCVGVERETVKKSASEDDGDEKLQGRGGTGCLGLERESMKMNVNVEEDRGGEMLEGKRDVGGIGLERETVKRKISFKDRVASFLDS